MNTTGTSQAIQTTAPAAGAWKPGAATRCERFAVTIVSPPGYPHSQTFAEIAETVHYGLQSLGFDSLLSTHLHEPGRRSILLGAHLLGQFGMSPPKTKPIIYNFEQIDPESQWINKAYLKILKRHTVWDYSERNIELLKQSGVHDISHVPIGWMPQLTRIVPVAPDIDVLFYGSLNDRRLKILNELKARNVRVHHVYGVYGKDRDTLIARSRIVLNLHFYESKIFEIARVSYLLGNGVCVVSENGLDAAENQYAEGLAFAPYEELVSTCISLLSDGEARARIANRGKDLMLAQPEDRFLQQVLKAVSP